MTTLRTTVTLALASAAGLCGCESAPRKTASNTREMTTAAPPAPIPMPGFEKPTAAVEPAGSNPSFYDPFAGSSSGVQANRPAEAGASRRTSVATTTAPSTPSGNSNTALNLYGEALAGSMSGRTAGTTRAAGVNLAQVSFSQEGADFDPDASRDGKQIVFASTQHRTMSDIYIKNIESRVVTQLTNDPANDVMPRISPDGTRVAFASNRAGNWDVFVMPIAGGRAVQITSSAADDLHPTWSADGTQVAFCRMGEVSEQWEMWVTDVGNSGVAKFIGYGLFPEWCPVGGTGGSGADRIAFQKSRERGDRAFSIWTIDYKDGQSGNTTEIVSSAVAACINPAWSRDGKWLAFATVPNPSQWANAKDGRPPSADLWMVDINGNTRIALTAGRDVNIMPTWGPSNRLFFVSDRGGTDNIWAMDTTAVVQLAMTNMAGNTGLAAGGHAQPAGAAPHGAPGPRHEAPVATVPAGETPGTDPH